MLRHRAFSSRSMAVHLRIKTASVREGRRTGSAADNVAEAVVEEAEISVFEQIRRKRGL